MEKLKSPQHSLDCGACAYDAVLHAQERGAEMMYQEGARTREKVMMFFGLRPKPVDPKEEKH